MNFLENVFQNFYSKIKIEIQGEKRDVRGGGGGGEGERKIPKVYYRLSKMWWSIER
jgi:hypothetical protein